MSVKTNYLDNLGGGMKTILKYPGAKNRLAPWIVSNMPSHEVYLEPFFGSGAVFFNKEPCRIETINDIDDEVYNFFKTVRRDFDMLAEQLRMTPFSRTEYENAFKENENDSSLEKARKFAVKCWMGFGASNRYKNGFRSSQQSSSPSTTKIWNEYPERLLEACSRLKNAQIENLDYRECLSRYDTKDVFIYADPPYMPGVRKGYIYKHEMDEEEHRQLLSLLLAHPGKVMISGYDTPLYSEMLKGWKKEMHKNQVECGLQKNECIWMNY